jgi:hypothetical protein
LIASRELPSRPQIPRALRCWSPPHTKSAPLWLCPDLTSGITFGPRGVAIPHRRPFGIYYPSVDAALADKPSSGPTASTSVRASSFCLPGFRLNSRELIMRAPCGPGGRTAEPLLRWHRLVRMMQSPQPCWTTPTWRSLRWFTGCVRCPCLTRRDAPFGCIHKRVRRHFWWMASAGLWTQTASPCLTCLPIGLAAGFVPHGKFGGEPSFGTQPNGLWLWQSIAHPLNALSPNSERDAGPGLDQDGGPANTMPECCVIDCGRASPFWNRVYISDGAWRELGLRGLDDWLARSGAESIVTLQPTATIQRGFQLLDKSRRVATG